MKQYENEDAKGRNSERKHKLIIWFVVVEKMNPLKFYFLNSVDVGGAVLGQKKDEDENCWGMANLSEFI